MAAMSGMPSAWVLAGAQKQMEMASCLSTWRKMRDEMRVRDAGGRAQ